MFKMFKMFCFNIKMFCTHSGPNICKPTQNNWIINFTVFIYMVPTFLPARFNIMEIKIKNFVPLLNMKLKLS